MSLSDWLEARVGKAVKLHLAPPDGMPEFDVSGRVVKVEPALGGGTVTIYNSEPWAVGVEANEYSVHVDFIYSAECDGEPYRP